MNAIFYIYIRKLSDPNPDWQSYVLVYRGYTQHSGQLLFRNKITYEQTGQWMFFNITSIVQDWIRHNETNRGLEIFCIDNSGQSLALTRPLNEEEASNVRTSFRVLFQSSFSQRCFILFIFRSRNPTCTWTLWKSTADVEREMWTTGRIARNIVPSLTAAGIPWKLIFKNLVGIGSSFQRHTQRITVQVQLFDVSFNYSKLVFNEYIFITRRLPSAFKGSKPIYPCDSG